MLPLWNFASSSPLTITDAAFFWWVFSLLSGSKCQWTNTIRTLTCSSAPQSLCQNHMRSRQRVELVWDGVNSCKVPIFYFFFYFYFLIIIYLFILAVLGLRFCARTSSSCGKRGPLFIAVRGPLTIASSLVADHRLQTHRLSSCGSRAQLLRGMWDLPRPGLEHVSPALAGRFSTTAPPGKPKYPSFTRACVYLLTGPLPL